MASFLRRKKNSDAGSSKTKSAVTQAPPAPQQPSVPTPLFARFASTAATQDGGGYSAGAGEYAGGARIVSSPMTLASGVRRENSTATTGASSYRSGRTASSSRVSVDKPLPGPISPANSRRVVNRVPVAPPPASVSSPPQLPPPTQQAPLRASLIIPDNKPLPIPVDQQAQQQPVRGPPGRNLSAQTSFQPPTPQASGRRSPPIITNLLDDEFDDATPQAVKQGAGSGNGQRYGASGPPQTSTAFPQQSNDLSRNLSSTMGNNHSAMGPSLYSSSIPMATRTIVDPSPSTFKPIAEPNPSRPGSVRRVGYNTSPPPPPGASPPVLPNTPYAARQQIQPQYSPQPPQPPPPQTLSPVNANGYRPDHQPLQHQMSHPPVASPPMKGPRIFAAMAASDTTSGPSPLQSNGHHASYAAAMAPSLLPQSGAPAPQRTPVSSPQQPNQPNAFPPPVPRVPSASPTNYGPGPSAQLNTTGQALRHRPSKDSIRSDTTFRTARMSTGPRESFIDPRAPPVPHAPQIAQSHSGSSQQDVNGAPRPRKLSKPHKPEVPTMMLSNGSTTSIIAASVKSHSTARQSHHPLPSSDLRLSSTSSSGQSGTHSHTHSNASQNGVAQVDERTRENAGLELDDDPFAKVEGVRVLSPITPAVAEPVVPAPAAPSTSTTVPEAGKDKAAEVPTGKEATSAPAESTVEGKPKKAKKVKEGTKEERRAARRARKAQKAAAAAAAAAGLPPPASPTSSEHPTSAASPEPKSPTPKETRPFPLKQLISIPTVLGNLLSYFSFYDWCVLSSVTREIRVCLVQSPALREEVFERFLKTVGYARWAWEDRDPLALSLQDLADYMRGVSTPSHEYARVAKMYVHSLAHPNVPRDPSLEHTVRCLVASTRAYTRVVLRLRAQAEREATLASSNLSSAPSMRSASTPPSTMPRGGYVNGSGASPYYHGNGSGFISKPPSRAPSPTMSNYSHHGGGMSNGGYGMHTSQANASQTSLGFRSPLFRLRRAPLLRVFVPSPEGDWLSDKSVLECEAELQRAGVLGLVRMGDVVWDIAVGDEGNVGRMVYDGKYLIDLDYTFNPIGDLPKYIPTLAFPPSYFHRVIRTGALTSNPVVHIDVSPWGEEIAANLQLLQDRVKTETPQGTYHNVVRWVHRSSFVIRPPARVMSRAPSTTGRGQPTTPRLPIPGSDNLFIDPGWYGTIVVETEGTNEALADLQERCGPKAFPPRPRALTPAQAKAHAEVRKVWRILREKSRPGEIWVRAVGVKERIL